MRIWAFVLLVLVGLPFGAAGQVVPGQSVPGSRPPSAAVPAGPVALTPQQVQQALEVLRDPARRAQFIAVLEALGRAPQGGGGVAAGATAGQAGSGAVEAGGGIPASAAGVPTAGAPATPAAPGSAPAPAPAPAPAGAGAVPAPAGAAVAPGLARLSPDGVAAQVVADLSARLSQFGSDLVEATRTVAGLPLIGLWIMQVAGDPQRQGLLFDTLWRVALVLALAVGAAWLVARLLRPLRRRLAGSAPGEPVPLLPEEVVPAASALERQARLARHASRRAARLRGWLWRVPFGVAALAIDLVAVLAGLAVGHALIGGGLGGEATPRGAVLAAIHAFALYRVVLAVVAMLVEPAEARLRLVPLSDATAAYVLRWARRGAAVGIFGYVVAEAGLAFGLYRLAHGVLINLVILVLAGFVVVIILQNRAAVAARIRPSPHATGVGARARRAVAPVWHVAAVLYVLALWVVLALDVPDGFLRLLLHSAYTVAVLLVARAVLTLVVGALHGTLAMTNGGGPNGGGRAPVPERPGRRAGYVPVLAALVRMAVGVATAVAVLEVWGVPAHGWFSSAQIGNRLLMALVSIGVTVLLAVMVWEIVDAAIERHLSNLAATAQPARSARLRTLLPMFRTTLLVTISMVAALTVLSEIGLNIAPLLAGAGVLGVAVGFGSQRLVQDVITGMFLLLENTMQVGDVVTLGGLSGTVETLSIRTIRLRALDGSMHIVPFSAVTTVTNQTRDFGYAVVDVSVGLNENTDHVADVLREVAGEMRRQSPWSEGISSDLEVMGVDRFIDNAAVLRTRIRTTPGQRWAVARELNRRIKQRFDELAIESPMTSQRALAPHVLEEASG